MNLLKCLIKTKEDVQHDITPIRKRLNNIVINELQTDNNDDSKYLYVILPYFNYCASKSRKQLFMNFINKYKNIPGLRICIAEAKLNNAHFELPQSLSNIYMHIGITTADYIWIKETLINNIINKLPSTWKYVAWIDADITFLNTNWIYDTIKQLQTYDIIQMFQTCINMGPNGEAFKIDKSFGYMHNTSKFPWRKDHKYGFWHPGYAWACTKYAYTSMNRLIDFGILGSGDHHMALALVGKVNLSYPGNIHENYKNNLIKFENKCKQFNLKLGYINGSIIHHWHGRLEDRKYQERWTILTSNNYDPYTDIYYTNEGYVQLSQKGKRFNQLLQNYFSERNEDCTTL